MTVYVDNARIPARVGRVSGRWSHLTADAQDELHAFAESIGLRRSWFQTCKRTCGRSGEPCPHWHYDVTEPRRAAAVAAGAVEIDIREMGAITTARRAALRAADGSTVDATGNPHGDALYDGARAPEACDIDGSHDEVRPAARPLGAVSPGDPDWVAGFGPVPGSGLG